jgi:deoxyribodipyrimidine photo-lyase
MDREQRLCDNWALLFAQQEALIRNTSLHILFFHSATIPAPESGGQQFQLDGLSQLRQQAHRLNIAFDVLAGPAEKLLPHFIERYNCHLLVTDFSPLRRKKRQCAQIGMNISIPMIEVDGHNIIPCWLASPKKEYAAYTLRPKTQRLLEDFLTDFPHLTPHPETADDLDRTAFPCITSEAGSQPHRHKTHYRPGCDEALSRMAAFVSDKLYDYDENRNNPNLNGQSGLSPYLHFGQLSPQRLALTVKNSPLAAERRKSFLEELIVRRELADNFCYYEPDYDAFNGFHPWAQKTLNQHRSDKRHYLYDLEHFENAATHEELWNSCQRNLVDGNKLHGYLRMYWAKKILEWSATPEEALYYANTLNDKYSIDGHDPNGYTGTAWSIGGVHDRAWPERQIFGKIRYMNEKGCRRKFKVDEYIAANRETEK